MVGDAQADPEAGAAIDDAIDDPTGAPTEPRPPQSASGRPGLALAAGGAFIAVSAAAAHVTGAAGFRFGFAGVAAVLAAGAVALLVLIGGRFPTRSLWIAFVVVVSVITAGALVDRAPASAGRLAGALDDLDLPLFRKVSDRSSGSSSCRPRCPALERRYDAPSTAPFAAVSRVRLAMHAEGWISDEVLRRDVRETRFRARTRQGYLVDVRAEPARQADDVVVVVRLAVPERP